MLNNDNTFKINGLFPQNKSAEDIVRKLYQTLGAVSALSIISEDEGTANVLDDIYENIKATLEFLDC